MTLTEALKQGDLVRRKAWPWWKCLNNKAKKLDKVWLIDEKPSENRWVPWIDWEDTIAEDWEVITKVP